MIRLNKLIDVVFERNTKKDWDTVWLISGDEGKGKSNLALHICEYWYKKLKGECIENDIRHINLDRKQYLTDLRDLKKYELTVYDEAGELSNRRAMAKFNVEIVKTYQVIRGDNLFTILVIPSIFDLEPFFAKRRVKGLIHVYKRGSFAFYDSNKIRKLLEINQKRYVKSLFVQKPLFYDHYPIYDGVLKEPYKLRKEQRMKEIRENLFAEMVEEEKKQKDPYEKRNQLLLRMKEKLTYKEMTDLTGLADGTLKNLLQGMKKSEQVYTDET